MRIWISLVLVFALVACQTTPKKRPRTATAASVQAEFQSAQKAAQEKKSKLALTKLKKITEQHPESDIADDAAALAGDIYYEQGQYEEAVRYYNQVANSSIESPLEMQTSLKAARALIRLKRGSEAIPYVEKVAKSTFSTEEERLEALEVQHELLLQEKQAFAALKPLMELATKHPSPSKKDRYRQMAIEVLESRLNENEIQNVADDSDYGFLQAPAKYRYALLMAEQRNYDRSRRYLSEVVSIAPDSDLAERASTIIQQIDARQKVDPRTIGVVLPLSGKQSAIGYRALRGIQHGLGLYGRNPTNFRLAVIDSEANPVVARRAVERLVTEDNVVAIIGGLLSKTAQAEASKANEFGVPIITLSQKAGITQIGDFVFRNAMTSQMQVQRLVEIAMGQNGLSRFAIIYPNDPYGVEFSNLFWDEVRARGGEIRGAQPYDPQETDFRGHVQRLVGTYYIDEREDYATQLKKWREKNPTRSVREGGPSPEEILPPIIDFEAVFIPDSARAVGQIAPMLAYNDVNNVRLLGTNIWNSKNLLERAQKFVENSIFVDSLLAGDKAFQASEFFNSYKQIFGEEPTIFEVQGHDSALMLRDVITSGEDTRMGVSQKLASIKDFPGALGILNVSPEREVRRPVVGLTVLQGSIVPYGTAPKPQ